MKSLTNMFVTIKAGPLLHIAMAMVFFGFGIAKFATYEQQAVAALVAKHPLLSIGTSLLGSKEFSLLLGVVEVGTGCLLLLGFKSHTLGFLGGALGVLTFLVTLTIFPFVQFYEPDAGKLFLSSTGQFLMKDLGLLAACIAIAHHDATALTKTAGR